MTVEEAAAVALATIQLEDAHRSTMQVDRSNVEAFKGRAAIGALDGPRSWREAARREALQIGGDGV